MTLVVNGVQNYKLQATNFIFMFFGGQCLYIFTWTSLAMLEINTLFVYFTAFS